MSYIEINNDNVFKEVVIKNLANNYLKFRRDKMKKYLLITFICLVYLCFFTITVSGEKPDVEKIKSLFDNTEVYMPEMTTIVDVTAANPDEVYSEVTVTNPNTTTAKPIMTSFKKENDKQIKNNLNNKKPAERNLKFIFVIVITISILVIILIIRFWRERNERK